MEEPRWNNGAEEYRTIQGLVREGRYQEALSRAERVLLAGHLGRRQSARLHALVCRVHVEELQQASPAALLHGEEAVRLARLVKDAWIQCEALSHLVHAYCQFGDIQRASEACAQIAAEVDQNAAVIAGGHATLYSLRATVAAAGGDEMGCLAALDQAEALVVADATGMFLRIRAQKVGALLVHKRYAEARELVRYSEPAPDTGSPAALEWGVARAWVALQESNPTQARCLLNELLGRAQTHGRAGAAAQCLALQALAEERESEAEARRLAQLALHRAIVAGRMDLATQFRRRLSHLL